MSDRVRKAEARRDFLARLVLIDPVYLPLFERADQKAVTTFIVTADSPVISSTCVFDVPHDVQQNVRQKMEERNG